MPFKISYLELWCSVERNHKESIMGNIHAKLYEFWTSGSGEDVERKSLLRFTDDGRTTTDAGRRPITIL